MNTQELIQTLEHVGLSDKESKVYLASLKLGGAAIQEIAEEAGVNRSTTHVIMLGLIERGLASSFTKGKKRYFAVESPEQLKAVLTEQEKKILEKTRFLEKVIPELKNIYSSSSRRPQVRFLEGREGIRALRDAIGENIQHGEIIRSFVPVDDLYRAFPDYDQTSGKKRVQSRVKTQVIYTHKDGPLENASSKKLFREARFIPKDKFPFSTDVIIYGDKVQLVNLVEPLGGIIIENSGIAAAFKVIFNLSWEAAEKYNKKK